MKLLLTLALTAFIGLAAAYFLNWPVYTVPVLAIIILPAAGSFIYSWRRADASPPLERPKIRTKPVTLQANLNEMDDRIAFALAASNDIEGAVFAHIKAESINESPPAILKVWQIRNEQLVRAPEGVYHEASSAPSIHSPKAKTDPRHAAEVFGFMFTAASSDHVEADVNCLYSMGLIPESRGGYSARTSFDRLMTGTWKITKNEVTLTWD